MLLPGAEIALKQTHFATKEQANRINFNQTSFFFKYEIILLVKFLTNAPFKLFASSGDRFYSFYLNKSPIKT
jgi:hypothetical protein